MTEPASIQIRVNRAQRRKLAKPWRVRKLLQNLARDNETIPVRKRKRPRVHNGYDARPETGSA